MTQPTGYQIANAVRGNKISAEFAAKEAKKYNVVVEFETEMINVLAEQKAIGLAAKAEFDATDFAKNFAAKEKVERALNM